MLRFTLAVPTLLALSLPVAAQDIGAIDYDQVFVENADQIEMLMDGGDTARFQLDLPGNVTLWADVRGEVRNYSAMDNNEGGSVGCLWNAFNDVAVLHQSCPGVLDEGQAARLEDYRMRVGNFVADNTVPPVPREAFWAEWSELASPTGGMECAAIMGSETGPLIASLVSEGVEGLIASILSVPRLPVETPCF
ncbi:MAG: hypothetical protein AAF376_01735 [Pseudomonadota bacterium]